MRTALLIVAGIVLIANPGKTNAHSGGLDQNGGHYNRKTGVYHYHRRKTPVVIPTSTTEVRMKQQQEKIEELEGRIQYLETALNTLVRLSNDPELKKQLEKLTTSGVPEKRIDGWNKGKRRVLLHLE